jgi:hypothetical protein
MILNLNSSEVSSFKEPKKIAINYLLNFAEWLDGIDYPPLRAAIILASAEGWTFYPTEQRRGYCKYQAKQVTIPMWAIRKDRPGEADEGYSIYYLAHEVAHIEAAREGDMQHGALFMKAFKRLCPEPLQHHEIQYKKRSALAAGIMPSDF